MIKVYTINHDDSVIKRPVKLFIFPGGEPHVSLEDTIEDNSKICIAIYPKNTTDIFHLLLLVDIFKRKKCILDTLHISYMPGARQDKVECIDYPFTLKVYSDLINSLNFENVNIIDPHSTVTDALINNVNRISRDKYLAKIDLKNIDVIISPDNGAFKSNESFALKQKKQHFACNKERDFNTGEIVKLKLMADDLHGANCIIIDDICDGGRTFIETAKALKEKNCGTLYLYITHGIFSKGIDELLEYYDTIYSTNSFCEKSLHVNHKIIEING